MKIAMFAGGGGSGGLKNYIIGFLNKASVDPSVEIIFYCTPHLKEIITNYSNNVKIVSTSLAKRNIWDIIFNRPLKPELEKMIKDENPDIVYFVSGIIPKGFHANKIVVEMHNQLYINDEILRQQGFTKTTLMLYANRRLSRNSIRQADAVVFDSKFSMEESIKNNIIPRKSTFAYFGVIDEERKLSVEKEFKKTNKTKLLYISTIFPYKNQIPLLAGLSVLKSKGYDFTLTLVGNGPKKYVEELKQAISKYELTNNVQILGWVSHEKVKTLIDDSDIFIYASSIETSGFGLMEGMVRGASIVCHNESCMPEVLKNSGLLFDVYDSSDVADKIEYLINNPSKRKELSLKALEASKEYTWDNHNSTIFNFLKTSI